MDALLQLLVTLAVAVPVAWVVVPQLIGRSRARAGDYAGAERWYGRALGADARAAGQGNIAVAQLYTGELEAAEKRLRQLFDYARSRRKRRLEHITLVNLGSCLIAQRRLHEAAPLLAWVVRDRKAGKQHRAAALYDLAWISYLEFDFEAAERGLAAARLEAPRGTGTLGLLSDYSNLGVLYELMAGRLATRTGNWDLARRHFDEAASRARRLGRGLPEQVGLSRGALEYLAGRREQGLEMVLTSAGSLQAIDNGDLAGRTMLGLAYIARGQGDEAGAGKLESAAAKFRGIMPMPSPEDCAAYLRDSAARD